MKDTKDDLPVLVVDLDGTLVRSDTLFECFWASVSKNWLAAARAVVGLKHGRAVLKRRLADLAKLDAAYLPYNDAVLGYIKTWRAKGGRVVLVTAADQKVADSVAAHLDLFDAAHGSDGSTNLKGETKAAFLSKEFRDQGYAYMGDSEADLPVWKGAKTAIGVDVSPALEQSMRRNKNEVETLKTADTPAYLAALRPHQWLKNVLVFIPVLAAQSYDPSVFLSALMAFVAFSMVSSSGYVLNDLMDLRADRAHPRKASRPLAAGRVPIAHGTAMVPVLLLGGLLVAAMVNTALLGVIALYFVLTSVYSAVLKRLALADIGTLAGLYTLRIIAGGLATELGLSVWLLAFSMFFFFSLAAVKRQAELIDLSNRGISTVRRRGYRVDDLPLVSQMTVTSGFVSVLVLALYLNAPSVQEQYTSPWLLWGICLVLLYWISRILLVTHRGKMHDDPIVFALHDRASLICILLMSAFAAGAAVL